MKPEIRGGAGPLETAAILAAIARLVEEQSLLASVPPTPPQPGSWVMSGRPRPVGSPSTRLGHSPGGWSIPAGSEEGTPDAG